MVHQHIQGLRELLCWKCFPGFPRWPGPCIRLFDMFFIFFSTFGENVRVKMRYQYNSTEETPPPCLDLPRNKGGVSSVGTSPAAFGGRIPLVKHCWAPSAPTEETPPCFHLPRNKGVSSEGGGFFCGIVLMLVFILSVIKKSK